jgi:hypothetical protein
MNLHRHTAREAAMKKLDKEPTRRTARELRHAQGLAVPSRAFTVIELLVAIGAVVIVSVGLAAIFDAVGKTVQGGRRLSVLSQYAIMVENEMRRDLAALDPDSFIVIRQQSVDMDGDGTISPVINGADGVKLYRGQTGGLRPRRIDEMVFFCRGDFASVRPSLSSDRVAQSREARVYYGQGQRMVPSFAGGAPEADYLKPGVGFRGPVALPPLGVTPAGGGPAGSDVNQYASEWTLLRHVTVLEQPSSTASEAPDLTSLLGAGNSPTLEQLADKDGQIALQPAAANVFRTTHFNKFPADTDPQLQRYLWGLVDDTFPSFATGTVDIATTDLAEIRMMVMGLQDSPRKVMGDTGNNAIRNIAVNPVVFAPWGRGRRPTASTSNMNSLEIMHLWMSDAFPTQSLSTPPAELGAFESEVYVDPLNRRVRYEPQPVGMRDVVEAPPAANATAALLNEYERAAQVMLTAHNFVPRCSEFIVEWSFGRTNPATNELIWHGPPRAGTTANQLCLYPFGDDISTPRLEEGGNFQFTYDANPDPNTATIVTEKRFHAFTDRLIYGETPVLGQTAVTSYFGYIDPTFDPAHPLLDDPSTPGDESLGNATSFGLMEWPRPKLIRVTMSLADPRDPKLEETFQFVFEVPQDRSK